MQRFGDGSEAPTQTDQHAQRERDRRDDAIREATEARQERYDESDESDETAARRMRESLIAPKPEPEKEPRTIAVRLPRLTTTARDAVQVVIAFMVASMFLVWVVFGASTVAKQNADILKGVQQDIAIHGQAAADRSCASTKLLSFIIFTADKRAHALKTGSYLTPTEKHRIHTFVDAACHYEPPSAIH